MLPGIFLNNSIFSNIPSIWILPKRKFPKCSRVVVGKEISREENDCCVVASLDLRFPNSQAIFYLLKFFLYTSKRHSEGFTFLRNTKNLAFGSEFTK